MLLAHHLPTFGLDNPANGLMADLDLTDLGQVLRRRAKITVGRLSAAELSNPDTITPLGSFEGQPLN